MKLPKIPAVPKQILIVATGVAVAGYVLNYFRSNEIVNKAISGFDK